MRICTECNGEFEDLFPDLSYFICENCLVEIEA